MENTNDMKDTIIQVEDNMLNKKNKFDKKLNKKLAKAGKAGARHGCVRQVAERAI